MKNLMRTLILIRMTRSLGWFVLTLLVLSSIETPEVLAQHDKLFLIRAGGKSGYINEDGQIVIAPRFDDAGHFSQNLAPFKANNKWGYINSGGSVVVEPTFEDADQFSEGLARVSIDGKFGYIN